MSEKMDLMVLEIPAVEPDCNEILQRVRVSYLTRLGFSADHITSDTMDCRITEETREVYEKAASELEPAGGAPEPAAAPAKKKKKK